MRFRELIQAKLPVRYLGARPIGFRFLVNHHGIEVLVEACPEPVFIGGEELMQNRLMCTVLDVPRLPAKP